MTIRCLMCLVVWLSATGSGIAQTNWYADLQRQPWLQEVIRIKLLESTASEVETVLGQPEAFDSTFKGLDKVKYFQTAHGRVTVTFTTRPCRLGERSIAPGSVDYVFIKPIEPIPVLTLNLPKSLFQRSREEDTPLEFLENRHKGIRLTVLNGQVVGVKFFNAKFQKTDC